MKNIISKFLLLSITFSMAMTQVSFADTYPELCAVFNRTLKQGDVGQDVKRLQIVLGQEGIAYLASTGYYGPATAAAVKVFQRRNGISPVGNVGPQTLRFMKNLWCFGQASNSTNPDSVYIPIDTRNPELPPTGWNNGGSNWNNSGTPEVSLQPVSSNANNVTISWNTRAVNSCTIQQDGGSFQNLQSSTGQQMFTLYGESRFTLKCLGNNGREYSKQIIVRPNQAISNLPWVNVSITPSQVLIGQQATLYWTSQNTSYCTSNIAGYTSNLQSSGSIPVNITSGVNTFTFTCYNLTGQSVSQTITANSNQQLVPAINNFTYSNNYLAWGTSNTNSCTISGGNLSSQIVPANGNLYVTTPNSNSTWTLTCFGGNTQSVTRQVNYTVVSTIPPTSSFITLNGDSDAQQYRNQVGTTMNFYCPPNLSISSVWGSDIYTDDSSICSAAVHVGKITQQSGGYVTVTIGGALNNFTASTRNGIASLAYAYWPGSFSFSGIGSNTGNLSSSLSVNVTTDKTSYNIGEATTFTINVRNNTSSNLSYNEPICDPFYSFMINGLSVFSTPQVQCLAFGSSVITLTPGQTKTYTLTVPAGYSNITNTSGNKTVNFRFYPTSTMGVIDISQNLNINVTGSISSNITATLSSNLLSVNSGQAVILNWTSQNATYCNLIGGTTNVFNQNPNGSYTVYPNTSTTYNVVCYNSSGQSANSNPQYITVNGSISGNITANIYANPTNTSYSNQPVTLTWSSSGATYCNIIGGNINLMSQSTGGSTTVYPTVSTNYSVTCYNSANQSIAANVLVNVIGGTNGVPTVNISASPNPMSLGQLTNLSWYSSNANYCNIIGGNTNLSSQPANGSYAVSPSQSTNYTITCYNNNGQNASAYVYVTINGNTTTNSNASLFITSNQNRNVNINVYKGPYNTCNSGYINWGYNTSNTYYTYPNVTSGSACQIGVTHTYANPGTYTITAYENNVQVASTQITVQ